MKNKQQMDMIKRVSSIEYIDWVYDFCKKKLIIVNDHTYENEKDNDNVKMMGYFIEYLCSLAKKKHKRIYHDKKCVCNNKNETIYFQYKDLYFECFSMNGENEHSIIAIRNKKLFQSHLIIKK